jgi:hypothetical protein
MLTATIWDVMTESLFVYAARVKAQLGIVGLAYIKAIGNFCHQ